MTTATVTRTAGTRRATQPAPGTWAIDPGRAVVAFSGKASFLAPTMSARFTGVDGVIEVEAADTTGASGVVEVNVDVSTMTTGNAVYDELIGAADPFDLRHFPIAVYRSSSVQFSDGQVVIEGTLTLRGVTRHVPLAASYDVGRDGDRMIVRAAGTLDRKAFGINFDLPGCGKLVPKVMRLEIDVDVVRL